MSKFRKIQVLPAFVEIFSYPLEYLRAWINFKVKILKILVENKNIQRTLIIYLPFLRHLKDILKTRFKDHFKDPKDFLRSNIVIKIIKHIKQVK